MLAMLLAISPALFTPPHNFGHEWYITVPGSVSVRVECFGSAGNGISAADFPGSVYGSPGGGAYAASTVQLPPGTKLKLEVAVDRTTVYKLTGYTVTLDPIYEVLVSAQSGAPPKGIFGGTGGQAAACVGQVKHSGGNGGSLFVAPKGEYWGGGGGGGAGPSGPGSNGTDATAAGPGLGGAGFAPGANGRATMSTGPGTAPGGAASGPNRPVLGGRGLIKLSW